MSTFRIAAHNRDPPLGSWWWCVVAANAGRKAKPANLRIVEGRGRGRDSGGRPIRLPPGFRRLPPVKPADLSEDAAEVWDEFVEELQRLQVTKPVDGPALEMACETYARWKTAKRERIAEGLTSENSQGRVTSPLVGIEERASKEFRAWCAEFGLTPAAEAKLRSPEANDGGENNPFD